MKSSQHEHSNSYALGGDFADNDFLNSRIKSNNLVDFSMINHKRERRMSNIIGADRLKSKPFLNDPYIGHSSKSNIKSSLRRSLMDTGLGKGSRRGSVNRGSNKRVARKETDNSIGTDYSDDDAKDVQYRHRNKELYKILKRIGV